MHFLNWDNEKVQTNEWKVHHIKGLIKNTIKIKLKKILKAVKHGNNLQIIISNVVTRQNTNVKMITEGLIRYNTVVVVVVVVAQCKRWLNTFVSADFLWNVNLYLRSLPPRDCEHGNINNFFMMYECFST